MPQLKLTLPAGASRDDLAVAAGTVIAGGNAIEVNIDTGAGLSQMDVLLGLKQIGLEIVARQWPLDGAGEGGDSMVAPPAYMVGGTIAADGWQMVAADTLPAGPVIDSDPFDVSRAGFNSSGGAVTYTEQMYVTKRIRDPYPDQANLTADKVACSDFIYEGDIVSGMTNNSALVSPKPVAKWVSLDRDVVGNSITPEIVAFHRDGIAYVEFRATDGVTTVTSGTSSAIVLGASYDRHAVIGYRATLDITSLTAGLITVHCKVWPRLGVAASVLDSADKTARAEFSARYYVKNTTLAASPYYVYVDSGGGGDDATGVVDTNAATAKETPVATVAGALQRINAVVGDVDGCIIRFMAGTHVLGSPAASRTQEAAVVTLTRDPDASRASVILTLGAASFRPRLLTGLNATVALGGMRIQDVTFNRTGTQPFSGEASNNLEVQLVDLDYDNSTYNNSLMSNTSLWWVGVNLTFGAIATSMLSSTSTGFHNLWRGCEGDIQKSSMERYCMVGCTILDAGRLVTSTLRTSNGGGMAFCRIESNGTNAPMFDIDSDTRELTEGAFLVQNIFEFAATGSYTGTTLSADGGLPDTVHMISLNNTWTGFDTSGRINQFYNETVSEARSHTLHRTAGNIYGQLNTKHDIFITDGTRVQGWSYLYGVGCEGEFSQFKDAGTFAQEYPGKNANIGTSNVTRNDPLFVDYQGTIDAVTAGANGGDYHLDTGSPCASILPRRWLPFDLEGTARPATNDAAGAYAA